MQTLSVSGPAELLTIIPYQLGFMPSRSVVILCLHDTRLGMVARLDAQPRELAARAAAQVLEVLGREAPTSVLLVGFEDEPGESRPLVDALTTGLVAIGVARRDRLVVRAGRWYCTDACGTCPIEGTAMPDRVDVPAVAGYVALGRAVLPGREALEGLFAGTDPPAHEVIEAIDAFAEDLDQATRHRRTPPILGWSDREELRHASFAAWARLLRGDFDTDLPGQHLPALLGGPRDVHVRDALIAWLSPTTLSLDHLPPSVVRALAEHCDVRGGPEVDAADAAAWFGVDERDMVQGRLGLLCRRAPDPHAAPVLSIAAAHAWAHGDGARASAALDRALEVEPDHRLCHLLRQVVEHGIRFEPRSA
ncbi:MAG: DUF4192 domain-containing protein [Micrococcales bacterium]|nr:DUF4192 domain-containing protein [Micrococcales bacterium]